jgi:carbon monoxide dehydrogenase subunit G
MNADAQPIDVSVRREGERVIVDVSARVAADSEQAWSTLTDFDHMAEFLSDIKSSTVIAREGARLKVRQTGESRRGFLHFSFEAIRDVELLPEREIRSRFLSGSGFKSFEFVTRIIPVGKGVTAILQHGEYAPTAWVPPVIGASLIEDETRKQYGELIAEMLRRQAGASQKR